ncbi:NADPH-dependent FMN reductase [Streptomyces sp. SID8379]|uniref:NADPH-dependent FMN reductase n=1 Tax=unclassified Streptomyces TaxID=2593676 RepID=UPI000377ECCB|nr:MULTISPECIES: NADPH-dependent FMN reductase [unclassified Streptomyces]MYW63761.1 NADPH-dependent FMN reductase [Streptomyces sp. SID8379]
MTTIGIILGSTRPGRVGPQIGEWVEKAARERADVSVELVDIAEYALPLFDEPRSPRMGDYEHEHTRAWAARIDALDGFVFVTPEYNRSIPAALKNAIDFVYNEWNNKAAGFIGYGSNVGGARAVDHLRHIAGAVQLSAVHTQLHLSLQTDFERYTTFAPAERHEAALRQLLTEVITLTEALAPMRRG